MSTGEFTIDKVSWHTETPDNTESVDHVIERFFAVVEFLQMHDLTRRVMASRPEDIDLDFAIKSSDLTEKGLEVMKAAYDKWLRKVDKGLDPSDTSILEKALHKKVANSEDDEQ